MSDVLTRKQRSHCMSRIRGKHTKPELIIRKGLFALGFRYQLHRDQLPGCPDLVLSKYGAVIFVHGCFWHEHKCRLFQWPKTNADFWRKKISRNRANDAKNLARLRLAGWRTLVVWECAIRDTNRSSPAKVINRVERWLHSRRRSLEISARLSTRN